MDGAVATEWQQVYTRKPHAVLTISGRQKQDFLIKSALYQKIVVVGNQVQFEKLRTQLDEIVVELKRITHTEDITSDLLAPIRTAVEIINGFDLEKQ